MDQKKFLIIVIVLLFVGCKNPNPVSMKIDLQGHRGCRGVLPENTIQAFNEALNVGVTTLEMDLCISKDSQVVVSHDPFFSHEISTAPNGTEISKGSEKQYNLFQLTYNEIKTFDVGLKPHPRFPEQKKIKAVKPLFSEVVKNIERRVSKEGLKKPYYNVEIKSSLVNDNILHPDVETYAKLVLNEIKKTKIADRICIQSFDVRALKAVKALEPKITTALLIENRLSPQQNLKELGFTPDIYSPDYTLVNNDLVQFCKDRKMLLIPWTVNKKKDIVSMLILGVDGIISDYPENAKIIIKENGCSIK